MQICLQFPSRFHERGDKMAALRNIETLTYREKIRDFAHLSRELADHLQQAMVPRVTRLQETIEPTLASREDEVPDVTVRTLVSSLLESECFAAELCERLELYAAGIVQETSEILEPRKKTRN